MRHKDTPPPRGHAAGPPPGRRRGDGPPAGDGVNLFDPATGDQSFERLRAELLVNISDELRTPLRRVLGPLQDLEDGAFGDLGRRARKQVMRARRKADRVLDLIDRLVDASRLDAGTLQLDTRRGNLSGLLHSVVERFASRAERRSIDLRFEDSADPVELRFDPMQLAKVFSHLIDHAVDVTPAGGRVRVTLISDGDSGSSVIVRISDDGPGISPERLPRIFDRFYGAGDPSSPLAAGADLGLSLARDLVELHGGTLAVETVEGVGSTFVVRLLPDREASERAPAARPETRPIDREVRRPTAPRLLFESPAETTARCAGEHAPLVLVAGDPADCCPGLHRYLTGRYRLAEAADGAEALERARELLPDIVICEARLDRLDGYALCQEIKRDPELDFVPVIMVTGQAAPERRSAEDEEDADSYLTRPFETTELIARIDHLIAARGRLLDRFSRSSLSVTGPGGLPVAPDVRATKEDHEFLERVRQAIGKHLGDEEFRIDDLAAAVALDCPRLERRLHQLTGITPARLILELRLKVAVHQLTDAGAPISEIAWMVGFRSLDHFNRRFRARFRMTPTAFRARW